jgi:hypothetical protein
MRWALSIVALVIAGALALSSQSRSEPNAPGGAAADIDAAAKQPHEATVDGYAPEERQIVQAALDDALRDLDDRDSELEMAAAVNAYLHQYFVNENATGTGAEVLAGEQAICGGTANTMLEMLYMAGMRARPAVLLGIPYQGNHSLVEVEFSDGARGLFDPTFGVFFRSPRSGRPIGMRELLNEPRLARTTLMKSRFEKRTSKEGVVEPISSIADAYAVRRNYRERSTPDGATTMDWALAFRVRHAGGVGGDGELRIPMPLRAGRLYGTLARPRDGELPWDALALDKGADGVALPWAYMIGAHGAFDVRHVYRVSGLRVGRRYRIAVTYNLAEGGVRLQFGVLGARRRPAPVALPDLTYTAGSTRRGTASVTFTARRRVERISARTPSGRALYQAIRVLPLRAG